MARSPVLASPAVARVREALVRAGVSLSDYMQIWAAAGHPNTDFPLTYPDLLRLTGGTEVDAAAPPLPS